MPIIQQRSLEVHELFHARLQNQNGDVGGEKLMVGMIVLLALGVVEYLIML